MACAEIWRLRGKTIVGCDPSEDEEDDKKLLSSFSGNATSDGCAFEAICSTEGTGACTHNLVDGAELANAVMQESERVCMCRGRADDGDSLRDIDGNGDPALLEF